MGSIGVNIYQKIKNMEPKVRILILHNIISPYKTLLFNSLKQVLGGSFKVLYWAETAGNREWRIDTNELRFPFDIMFKGKIENVSSVKMAIETYRRLNLYDPEVVIIVGYSYLACWAALIWAKRKKRKAVVIIESHYLDRPRSIIKENIKKLFVSRCDAALVDGTRHRDYTVSLGMKPENIFIKRGTGPVDISLYQREISRFKNNRIEICNKLNIPYKNFLYVGRFSLEKNIMLLLKAYKRLKKDEGGEHWGLILVGNGPQRKDMEDFISKNKIKDILFPGFKQKEELPLFYAISDVLILPSVSEPWGLVVSEAMASGLPVLVSNRCGCYPDIVRDGINGFSFDPFNEDELFGFMEDIIQGKYDLETMGKASFEIIKDYTPEKAAGIYIKAVNFVMKKNYEDIND